MQFQTSHLFTSFSSTQTVQIICNDADAVLKVKCPKSFPICLNKDPTPNTSMEFYILENFSISVSDPDPDDWIRVRNPDPNPGGQKLHTQKEKN